MKPLLLILSCCLLIGCSPQKSDSEITATHESLNTLVLDFPPPTHRGTPKHIRRPNLEEPYFQTTVLVPDGTKNLAYGQPVACSTDYIVIGELSDITDGIKNATDRSFVELAKDLQWIQIDLGASKVLYAVALWHYHAQARVFHDVIIQISDEINFVDNVKILFKNDHDNSAGWTAGNDKEYIETYQGKLIDAG